VHLEDWDAENRVFDATLNLKRRPLDGVNLARALWRYPMMTGQVILGIHWQARWLWLKDVPVHDHPERRTTPMERSA